MSTVTYSLKGFVGYLAMASNAPNVIAPLGELSAYSRTFAKDRELYTAVTESMPNTSADITIFSSRLPDGGRVQTPVALAVFMEGLAGWVYREANRGTFTSDTESFRQAALAEYGGQINDLVVGQMVEHDLVWMPSYVSFEANQEEIPGPWSATEQALMESPRLKLWFSDDRFRREYDEFDYGFVVPLEPLDQFFQQSSQVRDLVMAINPVETTERTMALANSQPYTRLRTEMFNYHDPLDPAVRIPTYWNILIWGAAGDNIDAIKEALIRHILANSTRTREEWARIFPDIFTSTEFIVAPFWSNVSVPNMQVQAGVYSPVVNALYGIEVVQSVVAGTGYTNDHSANNLQFTGIPFKSIALGVVGGPQNRFGLSRLTDHYPDYMNVATGHPDFSRMSANTRGLVLMLEEMLRVAESMTPYSDIPAGMTRLWRTTADNRQIMYLVKSYRDVQYLVVSGSSMREAYPPTTYVPLRIVNEGVAGVTSLPNGQVDTPYSTQFGAVGGSGVYAYALLSEPYGAVLAHSLDPVTGLYEAIPGSAPGSILVRIRVTDSTMDIVEQSFTLHIA